MSQQSDADWYALMSYPKIILAKRLQAIIDHKLHIITPAMFNDAGEIYQDGWNHGMETAQDIARGGPNE